MRVEPEAVAHVEAWAERYEREKRALSFFDCNLWLGRPSIPGFSTGFDLAHLLLRIERYAIASGIVSHFAAQMEAPHRVNDWLLGRLESCDSLWGGLVLTLDLPPGFATWDEYLGHALARKARLVRLFPKSHRFSLQPWCSGELLEALAGRRVPLALWHTEVSWEEVRGLCLAYPDLPVIMEGWPQKILYHNRCYYPLLAQHTNLYLELHNLNNYLGLEDIVRRFGAGQLLYGSHMPLCDPNAPQMMVTGARITDRDKASIAHGNMERLLSEVQIS